MGEKRSLRILNSFGPENPNRHDPDYWWRETARGRVWVGPVSGEEWKERYGSISWLGKLKPVPSYVNCWHFQSRKSPDVCVLRPYDGCKRCTCPKKIWFRFWLTNKAFKKSRKLVDKFRTGA